MANFTNNSFICWNLYLNCNDDFWLQSSKHIKKFWSYNYSLVFRLSCIFYCDSGVCNWIFRPYFWKFLLQEKMVSSWRFPPKNTQTSCIIRTLERYWRLLSQYNRTGRLPDNVLRWQSWCWFSCWKYAYFCMFYNSFWNSILNAFRLFWKWDGSFP